ncbi:MAG TPA: hypothetical protein VI248_07390 [Kineosporiaceae bacterium]
MVFVIRRRWSGAAVATVMLATVLAAGGSAAAIAATSSRSAPSALTASTRLAPFPGKTPREILNLVVSTMGKAASAHIRDRTVVNGSLASGDWVAGVSAGTGTQRTLFGSTFRVIRVGSGEWLWGDAAFWAGKNAPAGYVGHWVRLTSADYRAFAAFTYLSEWAKQVSGQQPVARVPGRALHGLPTLGLRDRSGIVLYVATRGKPYPQLLSYPSTHGQSDAVEYDRWDAPVKISPPPANQVVGNI